MSIYVGIGPPLASEIEVTSATLDLTTVASVAWEVAKPGGALATWAASIVSATPTRLVTRRTHDVLDVSVKGAYQIRAVLTVPGGIVRTEPQALIAKAFP